MNWIKEKIKWILFLIFGGGIVLGAGQFIKQDILVSDSSVKTKYELATEIKQKYERIGLSTFKRDIDSKTKVMIGGYTEKDFQPEFEIKKFNNHSVKISIPTSDSQSLQSVDFVGDKIIWSDSKKTVRFYEISASDDLPEGGYEIDTVYATKPATPITTYNINLSGVDAYYQPALTTKEIDDGAFRPENVVGSYALYAKGVVNGQTGKIGHIYRPKIVDSTGSSTWGVLNVENETLTVTMPRYFWNNATYPVTVDPTFGYTTAGGTELNQGQVDVLSSTYLATVLENGTVTSVSYYTRIQSAGDSTGTKGGIYNNDSTPDFLSSGDEAIVNSTTASWKTSTGMSQAITNTTYYVAYLTDHSVGKNQASIYYDAANSANRIHYTLAIYPTFTNPGPTTSDTIRASFYATYTCSTGQPCKDAVSTYSAGGSATTTISTTHTVGSLTNGYIAVSVHAKDTSATDRTPSSVTCSNGIGTLTQLNYADDASNTRTSVFDKVAPASGSTRCEVVMGGTVSNLSMTIRTYQYVDQSTPVASSTIDNVSNVAALRTNIATLNTNDRVIDAITINKNNCTSGTLQNTDASLTATAYAGCDSDLGVIGTASSTSMKWSWTGGNTNASHVVWAIQAAVDAVATNNIPKAILKGQMIIDGGQVIIK